VTAILEGVRILEVAEHTFVPASSALLADWGAEVIKIEHVERGDAMRGLASTGVVSLGGDVHALLEHSNRGKRSFGLDLTSDDGLEILYKLAAVSDIFLTNKLPGVRTKLNIGVEEMRRANPRIIYVRGTGYGERGPDANKGSYDTLAFWHRTGAADAVSRNDDGDVIGMPGPAYGDSIGAMTIAGGMMGALYHRERTGDPSVVDVSLLGAGMWALGATIALSRLTNAPWRPAGHDRAHQNPLVRTYVTLDDRHLSICCLQAAHYWPEFCGIIGRPDLAVDPRFADMASLLEHGREAAEVIAALIAEQPLSVWRRTFEPFTGQWTVVQNSVEVGEDPQAVANGYLQDCITAGGIPFQLVAAPIQFDEEPPTPRRAPEFNEDGDSILESLGYDWETIVSLKVRGVVA
jgi:crotonobetainyl-CoA:carnitine CoA-transferase CaiB-like acyl-CoA transferase